jgi:DNA-directed RNA polymerase II subunit RPB3
MEVIVFDVKELSPKKMTVSIKGAKLNLVNKLRIAILKDVKTLSIDKVIIDANTTIIPNKTLAHRLGLIPISSSDYNFTNCECCVDSDITVCENCTIEFKIDLICRNGSGYITTNDLETTDTRVKIANNNEGTGIPLAPIKIGQELNLKATTRIGTGKIHTKWCPVSICMIEEDEEDDEDMGNEGKNITKTDLEKTYFLTLESCGQLPPEKILMAGIELIPEIKSNYIFNPIKLI